MLNTFNDRIMIAKDSLKSRLFNNARTPLSDSLIRHLGLRNVERVISGKPNTLIIVAKDMVVKMPLDKPSEARCRVNKVMLKKLRDTGIAGYTPRLLSEGRFEGRPYYCEARLPGIAVDIPISNMDEMVVKAADFITKFHQETAREIIIDESNFKRLFGRDLDRLCPYLNDAYKTRLRRIEASLKNELLGKKFKTVWFHGDYKVENVLFDPKAWQIKGIVDWDLSRREGLPLLDVLYLLAYNESSLISKESVVAIIKNRFLKGEFNDHEKSVISRYLNILGISEIFMRPMVIIFWLNHVVERYAGRNVDLAIIEMIGERNV